MYPNYYQNNLGQNTNDDRFIGGFVFPFLLGGVTGAALAPSFYKNNNNNPYYYNNNYYYYPPYRPYYYGPYYR